MTTISKGMTSCMASATQLNEHLFSLHSLTHTHQTFPQKTASKFNISRALSLKRSVENTGCQLSLIAMKFGDWTNTCVCVCFGNTPKKMHQMRMIWHSSVHGKWVIIHRWRYLRQRSLNIKEPTNYRVCLCNFSCFDCCHNAFFSFFGSYLQST